MTEFGDGDGCRCDCGLEKYQNQEVDWMCGLLIEGRYHDVCLRIWTAQSSAL